MVVVGSIFWAGTAKPLGDPDIWWHVRVGHLILDSGIPREEPWAFTALGRPWVPTAWLSDVLLALTHDALGWRGIIFLKVLLSGLLLVFLARQLLTVAPARIAAPVYAAVVVVLSPFMAERPQLVSLVLVVWLANVVRQVLMQHHVSWWTVAVGYGWANLHGMWLLLPLALLVCAAGLALDRGDEWQRTLRRCITAALATVAAAALTPVGPKLAYWPLIVRDAASDVSEWRPTTLTDIYGLIYVGVFLLWVIAVARLREQAARSEILFVSASFSFGLLAGRNVAPALLLMAPWVCASLHRTFGPRLMPVRSPQVPRWLTLATAAIAVSATVASAALQPTLADGIPLQIVAELKSRPGTVRVFNSYSVGGVLTGFGAPEVSVAIDGRTDNYAPEFVHEHFLATTQMFRWRQLIARLDPDVVVTGHGGQLYEELVRGGWSTTLVDGDFVLLDPPGST